MQLGEEAKDEVRDGSHGREPREGAEVGTGATGAYGERCGDLYGGLYGRLDDGLDGGLYGGRDAGEIKKRKRFLLFSNNAYLCIIIHSSIKNTL